jgi:cytidine deaminase
MAITEQQRTELISTALAARSRAYAPYSHYPVGAALLTSTGKIFAGVNVENAAYPSSMCAERAAVYSAVTAGEQTFVAIVVATGNAGSPCGACRQVLAEFNPGLVVVLVDADGQTALEAPLKDLLPYSFGADDLG